MAADLTEEVLGKIKRERKLRSPESKAFVSLVEKVSAEINSVLGRNNEMDSGRGIEIKNEETYIEPVNSNYKKTIMNQINIILHKYQEFPEELAQTILSRLDAEFPRFNSSDLACKIMQIFREEVANYHKENIAKLPSDTFNILTMYLE